MNTKQIALAIDHTVLKPDTTLEQIIQLCEEAKEYQFGAVCVNPFWIKRATELLAGTAVKIAAVIGFPLGANTTAVKAYETKQAIENGATEIDMVLSIGALKSGDWETVHDDILAVVEAARGKAIVKVILETGLLSEEEKKQACRISQQAGADFVKTSTGFGPGGATVEDIRLMRQEVGDKMGVKASGGIRDAKTAKSMIEAGANRLGTSAGVAILTGLSSSDGY